MYLHIVKGCKANGKCNTKDGFCICPAQPLFYKIQQPATNVAHQKNNCTAAIAIAPPQYGVRVIN
jgi:hypothetical protein